MAPYISTMLEPHTLPFPQTQQHVIVRGERSTVWDSSGRCRRLPAVNVDTGKCFGSAPSASVWPRCGSRVPSATVALQGIGR
ncbi:MAG: hypothetical protein QOK02_2723 [Mycobacterium sp.]|jgi:hypothetical protein|nr:hypothetical protein [Mycobacterium sp.]